MKPISPIERKIIDDFLQEGKKLSLVLERVSAGTLVRLLRKRLFLTQRLLAKRAGVPQSTIFRVENETMEPSEKILKKIFDAMECDFLVLPLPRHHPDKILRERAKQIAQKRIKYLEGTMALEKQKPKKKWIEEMLEREIEELLQQPSKIWDAHAE